MATTATTRNATSRQLTIDYQKKRLLVRYNDFDTGVYENISVGDEDMAIGQVLGKVDGSPEYVKCKSAAIDGSQVPVAFGLVEVSAAGAGSTVTEFSVVKSGEINLNRIVFDGADDLDTMVTDPGGRQRSMKDWLLSEGFVLIDIEDDSEFDN